MITMRRREALAGLTAGLALGSEVNSAVALGILGTGGRGRFVGTLFAKSQRARIAAICDIFSDRIDLAKTQVPGADKARVYKNYEEMLAWYGIDAVLIATPVFLHPRHFEAAVKAGKHIYCEKPAGADVDGVKRLLRAGERADRSNNVGREHAHVDAGTYGDRDEP